MARQKYRANVFASSFPLISSFSGQSVIIPQIDQVRDPRDHHEHLPHPVFLENVMPMANGLQSIAFSAENLPTAWNDFDQAFYLRDMEERRTLYVPAGGKNYYYDPINFNWRSQPLVVPFGAQVSVTNIKGRQFVFFAQNDVAFEWDGFLLSPVSFSGLDLTEIMCLTSASAYNIAFSHRKVFWSSILDPTDFVPSLESGAGSESVLSLKGNIIGCSPLADGFMIYTNMNIVSASYTGNIRFPWTFKEVAGGAGIDSEEKITQDSSGLHQYAYTVTGMMVLDRNQATPVFPQVSEFFSGRRYEYYNHSTKKIVEVDTNDILRTKINFIAERYLVLSYGDNQLSFALIYDVSLKRWGKVAIEHVDCFEYIEHPVAVQSGRGLRYQDLGGTYEQQVRLYSSYGHLTFGPAYLYTLLKGSYAEQSLTYEQLGGVPTAGVFIEGQEPYKSIGFLQKDGAIKVVNFDLPASPQLGVLYLGSYQLVRNRFTDLFEVWAENVAADTVFSVIPSYDGFNYEKAVVARKDKTVSRGRLQKYLLLENALSFILRFEGKFHLSSLELVFTSAGYR